MARDGSVQLREDAMMHPSLMPPNAGATWRRWTWLAVALLLTPGAFADEAWQFDIVYLKNGRSLQGLLQAQTPTEIQFRCVNRKPGSHTVVIPTTLQRAEVDHLDLLADKDRELLAERLKALDPTGKGEAARMASLEFKTVPWGKDGKTKALRFESTHFTLESNAAEDIVRRAAVQLEQIFAAYGRFLPPRCDSGQPTTILLAQSLADYRALAQEQGHPVLNPALYDGARNLVLCGTDLQVVGEKLEKARQKNQRLLSEAKDKEAELLKIFKGKVPANLLKPIQDCRQEVDRVTKENDDLFQAETRQLFRTLYHEAFHAYLANFVYPPAEAEVPRWLNEGLAQIFETSFIEGGELRVGHADKVRLAEAQTALGRNQVVAMADLLRATPKDFVVQHASDRQTSDRYYLTSWAVAFYLTFERRLLGTKAMDEYVHALKHGTDPLQAFQVLVGQSPAQFDRDFHDYLAHLRPDGLSVRKPGR
jgi:hypothetical protein